MGKIIRWGLIAFAAFLVITAPSTAANFVSWAGGVLHSAGDSGKTFVGDITKK